ncbi:hypothetical protein TTRE_0000490901 [Trichuris trichiura]|uniref:Uncharacterized protein n=1 Tax=Trichuris trichiura TaxID=36087 RepID=A0A077ZA55_TRITR|nr:hypothetical protein TTRE_0000490901 [Trichuris trichiura]
MGKNPAGQMTAAEVLLAIFKLKMPHFLRKRWENDVFTRKEEVTLDSFFEFLRTQVEVEKSEERTVGSHQKPLNVPHLKHITGRERFATTAILQTSVSPETHLCSICSMDGHHFAQCPVFLKLSVKQRWRMAKEHRVCFISIQRDYNSAICEARNERCKIRGHITVSPKRESMLDCQNRTTDSELHIGFAKTGDGRVLLQTANGSTALVQCLLDVGSQHSFVRKDLADNLDLKDGNE